MHISKARIAEKEHKVIGNKCRKNARNECTTEQRSSSATKDNESRKTLILKDGTTIKVQPFTEHVKYFGKQLNLINHTNKDIEERIRKGFVKFNEFKPQLCAK